MGLEVLREVFSAERITNQLLEDVRRRGVDIASDWIKRKADLGDTEVVIEVDGRTGVLLEHWKKRIRLSWASAAQLGELLDQVYRAAVRATPVRSGRLAASWRWMFNKQFVSHSEIDARAKTMTGKDIIHLVDVQPYIRKAEKIFVPRGIVGPIARRMQRRFRGFVVYEDWLEVPGLVVTKGIEAAKGKKGAHQGRLDQRVPAIAIRKSKKSLDVSGVSNG